MEQGDYYATPEDEESEVPFEEFWSEEVAKKDKELKDWLDDFIASDEFAAKLKKRPKRDVGTRYEIPEEPIDDARKQKKYESVSLLYEKLQRALDTRNVNNTIANQKKGIRIIRDKIFDIKHGYKRLNLEKQEREENDRAEVLDILKRKYHFNLTIPMIKAKAVEKIRCVRKLKIEARRRSKRNRVAIVTRIIEERKRDLKIEKRLTKTYDYKVKSDARYVKGLKIVGTQVTLSERPRKSEPHMSDVEETPEIEKWEDNEETNFSSSSKRRESAESKKSRESKTSKKEKNEDKKSKNIEDSKSIKQKNNKGPNEEPFEVPEGVIVNKHMKIKIDGQPLWSDLIKDFDMLWKFLDEKRDYELNKMMEEKLYYDEDPTVITRPEKVIFKDFQNGHSYKKRIFISNGDKYAKKIRFDRIIWRSEIEDAMLLEVEPIGIQKLLPGLGFNFMLRFNPITVQRTTEAQIVFITYKPCTCDYQQFIIHMMCMPYCAMVTFEPAVICFKEVPIWRARKLAEQRKNYMTLHIKNDGAKECRIAISKIFAPTCIEQAWRNLISIMNIGDESENKAITSSDLVPEEMYEIFPRDLVLECVENVFNVFRFERNIFNMKGNSTMSLKVWFKDLEFPHYHVETYSASVYERFPDGKLYCIGSQDILVNAETTGHILKLLPDLVDFEVCVYDSVYQSFFEIHNPDRLAHNVRIKFPITMKEYLSCTSSDITIQSGNTHKVYIKFTPRSDILEENPKYYDKENDLLEFPIYVCLCTPGLGDTPSMKVDTFAVVTKPMGLVLRPIHTEHTSNYKGETLLDFGTCTTRETLFAEVELQNMSLVPHHFGFTNLPKCLTIQPNYGFGHLLPMEIATLQLYFSPEKVDLQDMDETEFIFQIEANTIKNIGAMKKQLNLKRVNYKLRKMEKLVSNPTKREPILEDIDKLVHLLRLDLSLVRSSDDLICINESGRIPRSGSQMAQMAQYYIDVDHNEVILDVVHYEELQEKKLTDQTDYQNEDDDDDGSNMGFQPPKNNRLWIRADVQDTLLDFSHYYVTLPDTPCGSYSSMYIDLKALKSYRLEGKKKIMRHYSADYKISGTSEEIYMEPLMGTLKDGESQRVYVVAKPQVPQNVIIEQAREIKIQELIKKKRMEMELVVEGKGIKDKNIGKPEKVSFKSKRHSSKNSKDAADEEKPEEPEIIINEKDVVYGYFDYYPAEMSIWRNLEPYFIKAQFRCDVTYNTNSNRTPEVLYVNVQCKVVQPDFIHDFNLQEIDFGKVPIGMNVTKVLDIQNIQYKTIHPIYNTLSILGGFSIPDQREVAVPQEFHLKLPITFNAMQEGEDIEFLEIVSDRTIYPFIVKAKAVKLKITFNPTFTVCRVEAQKGGYADCVFEVKNGSDAEISLSLFKVCEIEGLILPKPIPKLSSASDASKTKKNEKSSKISVKDSKFSLDLTEDEVFSLANFFDPVCKTRDPLFVALEDSYLIKAKANATVKIRFGIPPTEENGKNGRKESTQRASTGSKTQKYYMAKYNLTLGNRTHLKDMIIIGSFRY